MEKTKKWIIVCIFAFTISAFANEPIRCTEQHVYGLHITVRDIFGPIDNATVLIIDPKTQYVEWAHNIGYRSGEYIGAGERSGEYWVFVWAKGEYRRYPMAWKRVIVMQGECHVITKHRDFFLGNRMWFLSNFEKEK